MKLFISFFLLISFAFCFGQDDLPNDWVLNDLKGNVKLVEEVVSMSDIPDIKKIYNFDKNGLLTTIMEFNEYVVDKDSLIHNTIHKYENDNPKRKFTVSDVKKKFISSSGEFKVLKPNIYYLEVKMENGMVSHTEFEFKDELLVGKRNKIVNEDNVEFINVSMHYIYTNGLLSKIKITDNINGIDDFTIIKTTDVDEHGNFINQKYFDKSNVLIYEVKRKITYYD